MSYQALAARGSTLLSRPRAVAAFQDEREHIMSNQEDRLKTLIGHAKEYGFVFPSSEIYDLSLIHI